MSLPIVHNSRSESKPTPQHSVVTVRRPWLAGPLREYKHGKPGRYLCDECFTAVDGVYPIAGRGWLCASCKDPRTAKTGVTQGKKPHSAKPPERLADLYITDDEIAEVLGEALDQRAEQRRRS